MKTSRGRPNATCVQLCGREFAGLGLRVRRFMASQQERVLKELGSALELRRKLRLQDLRLRSWLQLDATSLAICCIWRVDKVLGGRRFQGRIASQQCEADAVESSVQLWSNIRWSPSVNVNDAQRKSG